MADVTEEEEEVVAVEGRETGVEDVVVFETIVLAGRGMLRAEVLAVLMTLAGRGTSLADIDEPFPFVPLLAWMLVARAEPTAQDDRGREVQVPAGPSISRGAVVEGGMNVEMSVPNASSASTPPPPLPVLD